MDRTLFGGGGSLESSLKNSWWPFRVVGIFVKIFMETWSDFGKEVVCFRNL